MLMTSNDEQPPTPISSISIGRGPRFWPPWSGGPSSCTEWPVPLVALKLALPVQSTVAFIGVSIGYSVMAGNASTVARNRPSCYKLRGTSVKTLTCRDMRGYNKDQHASSREARLALWLLSSSRLKIGRAHV